MQTMITYAIARTNTAIADEKCKGYACICIYTCICICVIFLFVFSKQAAVQLAEHKAGAKAELRRETASFAATENEGKTH